MGIRVKNAIESRLEHLVCNEEQFQNILDACSKENVITLRRNKGKKTLILIVAILGILSIGAGVYHQIKGYSSISITEEAKLPIYEGDYWLTVQMEWAKSSGGTNSTPYHLTDVDATKMILEDSINEILFPTYIPEDYSFVEAYIRFYLSQDMLMLEPVTSEMVEDIITETYILPESFCRNVQSFEMVYKNGSGDTIQFTMRLDSEVNRIFEENSIFISKEIFIPDFEKTVISNSNTSGFLLKQVTPIEYFRFNILGVEYRKNKYGYDDFMYKNIEKDKLLEQHHTFKYAVYGVESDSLSEEELIKIIKSVE